MTPIRKHCLLPLLCLCLTPLPDAAGTPADSPAAGPQPLGRLDRFWRQSAVLGPFLEQGYALEKIPDYLLRGDFPYPKRPYEREVPFADRLSVVRLLGGYNDGSKTGPSDPAVRARDLAWRGGDGRIRLRMELLRPRLQPWLDAGYRDLTLVLDNVPWCFPKEPAIRASYGQGVPPRDPAEWGEFVRALCRELLVILGPETANRLRFRVGTENNGRERFDGTHEQYERHYEASARAVLEVLPGAKVGPYNIAGISESGIGRHNVNAYRLAEFAAARGLPCDWVAFTRYFRPGEEPEWHADTCRAVWKEFGRRVPALRSASREIHEFGVAPWGEVAKGVFPSNEPGANGAALTAQVMWRLRAVGIDRLWHWQLLERVRDRGGENRLMGTGPAWVLSVLEHMAGGQAWLCEPQQLPRDGTRLLAGVSRLEGRTLVMISAYNADIARHDVATGTFRLPVGLLPQPPAAGTAVSRQEASGPVRATWLTRATAPYDAIRRDLAEAGQLAADFASRPDRLGNVREMAADRGAAQLVAGRLARYQDAWVESLTLKALDPALGEVQRDAAGASVTVRLAPPAILVLELR